MTSVLDEFDMQMRESVDALIRGNKSAAASFNRQLRMRIVREYKEVIAQHSADSSRPPSQRFESVHGGYRTALEAFLAACKGGALAWAPFSVLQDQLRMEQVDAREKLLRDEMKAGRELPALSEALRDARAAVALLGERSVPEWLLGLQQPPAVHSVSG